MAKVRDNIVTEGLSGKLGKRLVFRKGRGGKTILGLSPVYSADRVYNDAQLAHQEAFKKAIRYARGAKDQPLYMQLAKGAEPTAYNFAVADWFGHPEVLEIDASAWTGEIGQIIRINAVDDTQVIGVHVAIQSADGSLQEQGQAVPSDTDASWWVYTTRSVFPADSAPTVSVVAKDLPGNTGGKTWSNN